MYLTNEEIRPKLEDIGNEMLTVVAYGDALGLPAEMAKAEQILERYGRITRLIDITENPFIGQYPAGMWSDDTQLSMAVAQSLIDAGEFNMDAIVQSHVDALKASPMGWGRSTQKSVERLMSGSKWWESGSKEGEGNGILMKMAPLVYWQIARDIPEQESRIQLEQLTRMTHNNDLSVVTTLVHAAGLDVLARHVDVRDGTEELDFHFLLNYAANKARDYEGMYPDAGNKTSYILGEMALDGSGLTKERVAMYCPDGGFHSPETLGMVYGHLALTATYPEVMIETVNAGGDTDSTGSIVGTMSLFAYGKVELPPDAHLIREKNRLETVSKQLARTALRLS